MRGVARIRLLLPFLKEKKGFAPESLRNIIRSRGFNDRKVLR